jgi:hypothetical protein
MRADEKLTVKNDSTEFGCHGLLSACVIQGLVTNSLKGALFEYPSIASGSGRCRRCGLRNGEALPVLPVASCISINSSRLDRWCYVGAAISFSKSKLCFGR